MARSRPEVWNVGRSSVRLPVYFPSVSSVKTGLSPIDYVGFLNRTAGRTHYLVSAFDLVRTSKEGREALLRETKCAQAKGTVLLMDSGNYESYWKAPQPEWTVEEFHEALRDYAPTLAFGFDEQSPPSDHVKHLHLLNRQYESDRAAALGTLMIPIVHGSPGSLVCLCRDFARDQALEVIAVPERCLGAGVFERVRSILTLRNALDDTGRHVLIHLLGTGNPLSLALYAIAGADSFDGLEWCQTVVDHETALLHHFSQGDFFRQQTSWGEMDLGYQSRVLAHNLHFYGDWMRRLAAAIGSGEQVTFCRLNFPERIYVQCAAELAWE